ncbi:MAG TPA: S41 family peptidase [Xanthomonadales bacterium]|nr:S41 family peptidase [Xanthomonadales bacterium]
MKKYLLNYLLLVMLGMGATAAAAFQDEETAGMAPAALSLDDLRTFTDVFNQVRNNYVEPVDDKMLLDAAIKGMLSELDPHSAYLPDEEFQDLDESSRGRFSGIGVNVQVVDKRIVVQAVITPSPADSAGINPRDIILSIDDNPVKGRNLRKAIDELRGEPGSNIDLEILTPEGETRTVSMVRSTVEVPSVNFSMIEDDFGYFKVSHFNRETSAHLESTLASIEADGTTFKGIVLDLRDNPGGVLQPAVDMADGFLDEGVIVTTRGRNASMQLEFTASPGDWLAGIPIVILIDRGTASASEVLAGALQDHGRALVIGERSFGKGSVQSVLPLRNGAGIKLTTARYYTPSGRSIQALGIEPDVSLRSMRFVDSGDTRRREVDLDRHLDHEDMGETPVIEIINPEGELGDDYYVQEALRLLKGALILSQATGGSE